MRHASHRRLGAALRLALALALLATAPFGAETVRANPCNPCASKNPCNPCGGNPCNPCGGRFKIDPARVRQPSDWSPNLKSARLVAKGAELWTDRTLGKSGLACSSCHIDDYGQMQPSFAEPYPHRVAMPQALAGLEQVTAAEMVQFCMMVPMRDEPLSWDEEEIAALTAYVENIQPGYQPLAGGAANPCGANPCNPCGGNPCNPCGGR